MDKYRIYSFERRGAAALYIFRTANAALNRAGALQKIIYLWIVTKTSNNNIAQVAGKRKREIGLVVPVRLSVFTTDLRLAKIQS